MLIIPKLDFISSLLLLIDLVEISILSVHFLNLAMITSWKHLYDLYIPSYVACLKIMRSNNRLQGNGISLQQSG